MYFPVLQFSILDREQKDSLKINIRQVFIIVQSRIYLFDRSRLKMGRNSILYKIVRNYVKLIVFYIGFPPKFSFSLPGGFNLAFQSKQAKLDFGQWKPNRASMQSSYYSKF